MDVGEPWMKEGFKLSARKVEIPVKQSENFVLLLQENSPMKQISVQLRGYAAPLPSPQHLCKYCIHIKSICRMKKHWAYRREVEFNFYRFLYGHKNVATAKHLALAWKCFLLQTIESHNIYLFHAFLSSRGNQALPNESFLMLSYVIVSSGTVVLLCGLA